MKIQDQPVMKVLLFTAIGIFILMVFWVKILGASEVTIDVEKNGYCKQYGDDWSNRRYTNICYYEYTGKEPIEFTEQEFKSYCPSNNFLSTKFYSDCFHSSGSIV